TPTAVISGGTGAINITAGHGISNSGGGSFVAPTVNLTAGAGDISATTTADNLQATASAGSVNIVNTSSNSGLTLAASSAANGFTLSNSTVSQTGGSITAN